MSKFIQKKIICRQHYICCFHLKKTTAESYWLLQVAYGDNAPSLDTCAQWFWHFRSSDFDVADTEHGKLPKTYYELLKPGETINNKR